MLYVISKYFKRLSLCMIAVFLFSSIGTGYSYAAIIDLPTPGLMIPLSSQQSVPLLKGLRFDQADPLNIQFVIEKANGAKVSQTEASRLINYFLTSLTVAQDDIWVNLSPYESDRIMDNELAQTELGQELLEQDYILKQLSASLTHPDTKIGSDYWQSIKDQTDAFNKIWIMPDEVEIYEGNNAAYVTKSTMKVMTDADLQAMKNNQLLQADATDEIKDILLPKIADDVNNGQNFSKLRQVYNAIVLANWFKAKFKNSFYNFYFDSKKTAGLDLAEEQAKDKVYNMYVDAFKKGAYNYIKKEYDTDLNAKVKKHYFCGGIITQSSAVITNDSNKLSSEEVEVFNVKTQLIDGDNIYDLKYDEQLEKVLYDYGYRDHVIEEDKDKEDRLNKNLHVIEEFFAQLDSEQVKVEGELLLEFADKVQAYFEQGYLVSSKKKYMLSVYEHMLDYYTQFVELEDQDDVVDQLLEKMTSLDDYNYVYSYVVSGHYVNESLFDKTLMHFSVADATKAVKFQTAQDYALELEFISAEEVIRGYNAKRVLNSMATVVVNYSIYYNNLKSPDSEKLKIEYEKSIKDVDKLLKQYIKKAKKGKNGSFYSTSDAVVYEKYLKSNITADSLRLFLTALSYDGKAANFLYDHIYWYQTSEFLVEYGVDLIINSIRHGGTSLEYSADIRRLILDATDNKDLANRAYKLVNRSSVDVAMAEDRKKFSSSVNAAILRNNSDLVIGFMDSLVTIEDEQQYSKILTDYTKKMSNFAKRLKKKDATAVFFVKEYSDYYQGFVSRADYNLSKLLLETLAYDSEAAEFIYDNIDIIASENVAAAVKILERTVNYGAYVYAQNARELLDNVYVTASEKNAQKAAKLVTQIEIRKESSGVELISQKYQIDGGISFDGVASNITTAEGSSAISLPVEILKTAAGLKFEIINSVDYDDLRRLYVKNGNRF